MPEDYRVEVELDDEEYGYSLWERLRALHLDDEARQRLGKNVVVTRDGSQLFLYAIDEAQAREAKRVVRDLIDEDALSAEVSLTRWHPVEESWKPLSVPLPRTTEEETAEYAARESAEALEAEIEGEYDWNVVVRLPGRDEASSLAGQLADEGLPVARRWHYVVVGAVTEERADELADRLRGEFGGDVEVSIEANVSDVPGRPFQFIGL